MQFYIFNIEICVIIYHYKMTIAFSQITFYSVLWKKNLQIKLFFYYFFFLCLIHYKKFEEKKLIKEKQSAVIKHSKFRLNHLFLFTAKDIFHFFKVPFCNVGHPNKRYPYYQTIIEFKSNFSRAFFASFNKS